MEKISTTTFFCCWNVGFMKGNWFITFVVFTFISGLNTTSSPISTTIKCYHTLDLKYMLN